MRRWRSAAAGAAIWLWMLPGPASAHGLVGRYESSLPLELYVLGAAVAVAVSFLVGFVQRGTWRPAAPTPIRQLPRWFVVGLRVLGLTAWLWIALQLIVGGSSDAEVAGLFTWTYGWVGLAMLCALIGPAWHWLDPFTTLNELGAAVLRRMKVTPWRPAAYPARLSAWPAVATFALIVWLELAYRVAPMGPVVLVYTLFTLVAMAQYGREAWMRNGEVFSVWFGILGRSARYVLAVGQGDRAIRRQPFPDGLLGRPWRVPDVAMVAIATAGILYDGLSQTRPFFDLFGLPDAGEATFILAAFLVIMVALALGATRLVGTTAVGAGLLPISVGYLIAHYLTTLVGEGQRILVALSDPLQQGWDLFGTAFHESTIAWIPPSAVWAVMFAAVVGGHVLGAWSGHLRPEDDRSTRRRPGQMALALLMVALTSVTLWSLGQVVFRADPSRDRGVPAAMDAAWPRIASRGILEP